MNMAFCFRRCSVSGLIFFACMMVNYACKKEIHPAINFDNSFNKGIAFQEDFEPIAADWLYYNTDTVSSAIVKFIALDSSALSYTWTIEATTYNAQEIRLNFPRKYLLTNKQIPVKLAVRYTTVSKADTVKIFSKLLTFANPCASKCNGVFKGSTDDNSNPDSFQIGTCANDLLHPATGLYLENFQLGCGRFFDELPDSYNIGYKQILFSATGEFLCNSPSGIIAIYGDSICINYRSFDNGKLEAPVDHVFKGVKK
ncbi:MAG: hypothetical protein JWR61_4603 [Ferruginibacter sp.]|uniref:hypothetical protein n=1 Tax=Ferruginibacter sp. TaxID=1940288 RepID=UPI002657AC80|nr:hypothetical protein [Ferruginibacter sp.]MDB5279648.1 hypothetical protein [Ferruginibacter sp.]